MSKKKRMQEECLHKCKPLWDRPSGRSWMEQEKEWRDNLTFHYNKISWEGQKSQSFWSYLCGPVFVKHWQGYLSMKGNLLGHWVVLEGKGIWQSTSWHCWWWFVLFDLSYDRNQSQEKAHSWSGTWQDHASYISCIPNMKLHPWRSENQQLTTYIQCKIIHHIHRQSCQNCLHCR